MKVLNQDMSNSLPRITSEHIFDPDGDLQLCVSESEDADAENTTFLVSRATLCLASPVLRAMLGKNSRFRESVYENPGKHSGVLPSVNLKGDNTAAFKLWLGIIHLQHRKIPRKLSYELLFGLACLCGKYDLLDSLGLWYDVWIEDYKPTLSQPRRWPSHQDWLSITYALKLDDFFPETTRECVLESTLGEGGRLMVKDQYLGTCVPETIMCTYANRGTVGR